MKRKIYISIFILSVIVLLSCVIVFNYYFKLNINNIITTKDLNSSVDSVYIKLDSYELGLVRDDLNTYGYLSQTTIDEYLKTIEWCNKEDEVPIGLLHAVSRIESDYRFWVEHKEVRTMVNNTLTSIRAVGSGGIIWELWKDSLIYYNRASERSDLFLPYFSMKSTSLILKILIKSEIQKKQSNNIVGRVLIRYYGAYDKDYYDKTITVTSDLWMKRMNGFLKQNFGNVEKLDYDSSLVPPSL